MALDPFEQVLFFGIPIGGYYLGRALLRKILGIRYIDPSELSGVKHCFDSVVKKTLEESEGSGNLGISLDNVQLTRYIAEGDGYVTLEGVDKTTGLPVKVRGKVKKDGRIVPVEDCVLNNLQDKVDESRQGEKAQVRSESRTAEGKSDRLPYCARRWIRRSEWKIAAGSTKLAKIKFGFFKRR